jgi:hypothetical protein
MHATDPLVGSDPGDGNEHDRGGDTVVQTALHIQHSPNP